ncbi:hypothetical protein B0J13DRAFT_12733 [Dactylonectria estremocensis]|uniref:Uncharacterized protein n=1 Tax=Dactylonectria estremocensis TaxID=1079267 RepID=A0A9P9FGW4_9HYPO|nr:hypothetical protein B0J13DRAFT_12733 [Dactylonectria estremocensis]
MIRTTVRRHKPQVAIPSSINGGRQQDPWKPFIRNTAPNGDTYYVLNRRGRSKPRKPLTSELFEVSDILLDLEDIDSPHVRPFTEGDEARLRAESTVTPAREKLKARLAVAEEQINRSRNKAFEISSKPANAWRLTSHDILSVALRGAPVTPLVSSDEQAQPKIAGALTAAEVLDPRKGLDILHTVCSENGITDYGLKDDERLLQWLKFRQSSLHRGHQQMPGSLRPNQFTDALKELNSIASIRRLVSQSLSSGLSATFFQSPPRHTGNQSGRPHPDLSLRVREACGNVLDQLQPDIAGNLETMTFLGNLSQRLSESGAHLGGPLCGLGLRLSASIANSEATLVYLVAGFKHNIWTEMSQATMADVLFTFETYSRHLTTPTEAPLDVSSRETLLQILTGIGEGDEVSPETFRSLALFYLETPASEKRSEALRAWKVYISILGQLGAVATLWKEWHLMRRGLERSTQTKKNSHHQLMDGMGVGEDLVAAARAALSVVALREVSVPAQLELAECVVLDWESIEMQNPDAWLRTQENARPIAGFPRGDTRAALDLPLDGWLEAVQQAAAVSE